jgi:hypothetical protein
LLFVVFWGFLVFWVWGLRGLLRGFLLSFVVLGLTLFVVGVPVCVFAVAGVDEARVIACYDRSIELWIYNTTMSGFQFHQRSVWLRLNVTV